jgi:hypothetical protein
MAESPKEQRDPFIDLKERIAYEMDKGEETGHKTLENMASLINDRLGDHMNEESVREFWESVLTGMDEFEDERDVTQ